jgi:hypothetical protein
MQLFLSITFIVFLAGTAVAGEAPPAKLWGAYCLLTDAKKRCPDIGEHDAVKLKDEPFVRLGYEHCRIERFKAISRQAFRVRLACATTRPGPVRTEIWTLLGSDLVSDNGYILRRLRISKLRMPAEFHGRYEGGSSSQSCNTQAFVVTARGYRFAGGACSLTSIKIDDEGNWYSFRCVRRGKVVQSVEISNNVLETPLLHSGAWQLSGGKLLIHRGGESMTFRRCRR